MKRFLFYCMLLASLFLCIPVMAQGDVGQTPDYGAVFETFAALAAVIPFVTEFIKKLVPGASSFVNQFISWMTGIAITALVWVLGIGFLKGMEWYVMLLYGLGASLVANGIFDTGLVSWIIGLFGSTNKRKT